MDMVVSTEYNVSVKEYNKIGKYKNVETETEKVCHI